MADTRILTFTDKKKLEEQLAQLNEEKKRVAEEIAKQTGADIAEIEPVVPYDSNRDHYNALARLAKKEHDEDQRPAIKNEIDIDVYDRIYIGYPMWW